MTDPSLYHKPSGLSLYFPFGISGVKQAFSSEEIKIMILFFFSFQEVHVWKEQILIIGVVN